jgi:hypothetical protein
MAGFDAAHGRATKIHTLENGRETVVDPRNGKAQFHVLASFVFD